MYKCILLLLLLSSTVFGQTTGKQLEFNSAWGVDYESNMVKNPSAAKNLSDTLKLGATLSRDTSAGNKIDGKASFLLDAGALNDYLELDLYAPSDEQTSGNCGFKGVFKGDATLYRAQILDGSSNVLAQTVPLTNETGFREFRVWYPCGASGARKVRITQTEAGTAPAINVGKFYYGRMEPGAGTFPNQFSAKVSSAGVLSTIIDPTNNFDGSTFAPTDTSSFDLKFKNLTSTPNCDVSIDNGATTETTSARKVTPGSPTGLSVRTGYSTTSAAFTKFAYPFTITCTKTGSDYVQPAITAQNFDYSDRTYTPTVTGLGSGSATVISTHSRKGSLITICTQLTKDATNGTGAAVVELTSPSGITFNTAAWSGGVRFGPAWSSANSSNVAMAVDPSTSKVFFYFGTSIATGASYTANSTTRGCVTFPASEGGIPWTETQGAPQLVGSVIADTTIKADKSAGVTSVDYGTYSATATNVTNATSITSPISCSYFRMGSTVNVTCRTTTGCTTASGTNTKLNITLPISTTQSTTIIGTLGAAISGESGRVLDNGSNLAQMDFFCQATTPVTRPINFTYQVP